MNDGSEGPSNGEDRNLTEVRLDFETMRQLQAELAPTLSNDGFFIPTPDPSPPDTVLRFSITLPEDFVLIEGTGVVIWVRYPGEEEGTAGMAVRYISLSRETQETIDAIIDAHLASGGGLFDLEPTAAQPETYPTDALGGSEPIGFADDNRSAREATARQLDLARVTIRGESEDDAEASPEAIENEYLTSVEAQVEEAVASITPEIRESESNVVESSVETAGDMVDRVEMDIRGSTDGAIERGIGLLQDDEEPAPDFDPAADSNEPHVAMAEPVEPIIVDEQAAEVEPVPDEEPPDQPADAENLVADPEGASGGSGEKEVVIESLIPVFLEKWKQEIDGDSSKTSTDVEDAGPPQSGTVETPTEDPQSPEISISETVAIELGSGETVEDQPAAEMGSLDPTLAIEDSEDAASQTADPMPDDEPVDRPGSEFEVSGFDPMPDSDIVMTPPSSAGDDEVTLVASEPPRSGRLRPILLIPVLLVVVVAIGVYMGWDRILGFVEGMRSSEQTAQRDAPERDGAEDVVSTPPEAATSTAAASNPDEPVDEVDTTAAPSTQEIAPPMPTPETTPRFASQPATRIDSVTWRNTGGGTEVTILGNGRIAEESVTVFPMRDPARILVRVREIQEKYPEYEIAVNSTQVGKIRIGHHPEQSPPALYVVIDLVDPLAGVADFRVEGDTVRITVEVQ